ncbi:Rhomboid-like protein 18 [Diplonema papillatum]|nr:Rhomboid-like protein 18 [Diplonema papillatum]
MDDRSGLDDLFYGVPVSKAILLGTVAGSSIGSMTRYGLKPLNLEAALDAHDFSKLVLVPIMPFYCNALTGLVLGSLIILAARPLERWSGPRKFSSYVAMSTTLALVAHCLLVKATPFSALKTLKPGPTALLFSLVVKYHFDVPSTSWFSTKMAISYMAIIYSSMTGTNAQAVMGVLGGLLTCSTVLPFRNLLFPQWLCSLIGRVSPLLESTPPKQRSPGEIMAFLHGQGPQDGPYQEQLIPTRFGAQPGLRRRARTEDPDLAAALEESLQQQPPAQHAQQQWQQQHWQQQFGDVPSSSSASVAPDFSPDSLQALLDMGFEEPASRAALSRAGGSVDLAINFLMQ